VRIYNRALSAADVQALYGTALGQIRYDTSSRVPEYFYGAGWMPMGPVQYIPTGVYFDGTNDYLTLNANFTGVNDGTALTGSFWFRREGNFGARQMVFVSNNTGTASDANSRLRVEFAADNRLEVIGYTSSAVNVLDAKSNNAYSDSNWHHAMFSFDLTNPAHRYMYIDGASDLNGSPSVQTNVNIDFKMATPRNSVGARYNGNNMYSGDLADFWLDIGRYADLSDGVTRGKFYNGGPVYLGTDGSTPFGAKPSVFLSGDVSTWQTNDGAGGGFTLNGALDATTGPGTPAASNITAGLVSWWKLDDVSGTNAADSSGHGNDGTMSGGQNARTDAVAGKVDGALQFNGTSDYIDVPNIPGQNRCYQGDNTSVSAWIYPDSITGEMSIWTEGATAYTGRMFFSVSSNGELEGGCIETSGTVDRFAVTGTGAIPANQWTHVAMTYDTGPSPDAVTLYINGAPAAVTYTTSGSGDPNSIAGSWDLAAIGNCVYAGCSGAYFDGAIDDVRTYDRALSAQEISQIYQWGATGGLVCSNPSRKEGSLIYNTTSNVMQYCDGATWRKIGK
jgi:Concanavalin A-like lectin/glucanases superfamily